MPSDTDSVTRPSGFDRSRAGAAATSDLRCDFWLVERAELVTAA